MNDSNQIMTIVAMKPSFTIAEPIPFKLIRLGCNCGRAAGISGVIGPSKPIEDWLSENWSDLQVNLSVQRELRAHV